MLLINLIFEFCIVIVQAGCTPRAWLLSDLATSCLRHLVAKSLSNHALGTKSQGVLYSECPLSEVPLYMKLKVSSTYQVTVHSSQRPHPKLSKMCRGQPYTPMAYCM